MSIVVLLRLHKGLGFEIGCIGVFGRLGLHVLRSCKATTCDLNHHTLIPQERTSFGHLGWACELISLAILGWLYHGWSMDKDCTCELRGETFIPRSDGWL